MKLEDENFQEIKIIEELFRHNKIKCVKYNYNIDNIQRQHCNDAFIQLSSEGDRLIFTKKVVKSKIEKLINTDQNQLNKLMHI